MIATAMWPSFAFASQVWVSHWVTRPRPLSCYPTTALPRDPNVVAHDEPFNEKLWTIKMAAHTA
jgi:hypothetical protein